MYRIYRHSITPQGAQEGKGDSTSTRSSALLPGVALNSRLGSQAPSASPAAACFCSVPSFTLPPSSSYEPHELRLRRIISLGAHGPHLGEEIYTTEHRAHGKGKRCHGRGKAGTLRGGWAEPPASPEGGTASRSHKKKKKKEKIIQPKGRRWRAKCPIYTQHCKHTQSILHVLQSGVCMSVSQSRGRISGALS